MNEALRKRIVAWVKTQMWTYDGGPGGSGYIQCTDCGCLKDIEPHRRNCEIEYMLQELEKMDNDTNKNDPGLEK